MLLIAVLALLPSHRALNSSARLGLLRRCTANRLARWAARCWPSRTSSDRTLPGCFTAVRDEGYCGRRGAREVCCACSEAGILQHGWHGHQGEAARRLAAWTCEKRCAADTRPHRCHAPRTRWTTPAHRARTGPGRLALALSALSCGFRTCLCGCPPRPVGRGQAALHMNSTRPRCGRFPALPR